MKNRKLILILSLVLALTMSLGGTLAYLTDTASEVNTMTLGNVDIENREYERRDEDNDGAYDTITTARGEGYKLYEYSDAKPLLPAVGKITGYDSTRVFFEQFGEGHEKGAMDVFDNDEFKNVQDKFVFVENTGKTDAFVRTYIAYEVGNYVSDEGEDAFSDGLIMTSMNTSWKKVDIGLAEINGNNYFIVEYNYDGNFYNEKMTAVTDVNGRHPDGIVHPGEYTYNNLAQVYLAGRATNEDMVAIDGNANGTLDILVLSQAIQANGFADMYAAFDEGFPKGDDAAATIAAWFEGEESTSELPSIETVKTVEELQARLNDVPSDTTIVLGADIVGNVTYTQATEYTVLVDGNGYSFTGLFTVNGKSAAYETAKLIIKDVNFVAKTGEDSCIEFGVDGDDTNQRYVNHVTISNCTFSDPDGVVNCAAVRSFTGGDKNVTIENCTVNEGMHSLCQLKNVAGLTITGCKVYSKNGANLNSTPSLEMSDCTFDVQGYAVRFGVSTGGNPDEAKNFVIKNSTLESACDDGDAVIIFRTSAANANTTLTLENTELVGTLQYTGAENINKN